MKTIKCDLPREFRHVELMPLADLHDGDKHCDIELVKQRISYIERTPHCYTILNGDLMNNAVLHGKSDMYSQKIPPMEQLSRAKQMFGKLASQGKILAIDGGNHERRSYKGVGLDLSQLMAEQLGLGDVYSDEGVVLFVRVGEQSDGHKETNGSGLVRQVCYVVYMIHGSGGGKTEGAKINALANMSSVVDADIYIHSHTHLPAAFKEGFFRTDVRNSTIAAVTKLFVNSGAFLDYGGYAEVNQYKPAAKDTPVIILSGTHKEAAALV